MSRVENLWINALPQPLPVDARAAGVLPFGRHAHACFARRCRPLRGLRRARAHAARVYPARQHRHVVEQRRLVGPTPATAATAGTTIAGKACLDTATAYATAAQRCGGDYDAERAAFIRDLANGDCDSVSIRNETELRNAVHSVVQHASRARISRSSASPRAAPNRSSAANDARDAPRRLRARPRAGARAARGTPAPISGNEAEQACLDTIEAFARAAERCGAEYKTTYDELLARNANGDCKNVRTIRDEAALRKTCLPFMQTQSCKDLHDGFVDPSCAAQLQRAL